MGYGLSSFQRILVFSSSLIIPEMWGCDRAWVLSSWDRYVTTFIAGVFAIRKGLGKPIGSLTQMATIRLGKRTEWRNPLIKVSHPSIPSQ